MSYFKSFFYWCCKGTKILWDYLQSTTILHIDLITEVTVLSLCNTLHCDFVTLWLCDNKELLLSAGVFWEGWVYSNIINYIYCNIYNFNKELLHIFTCLMSQCHEVTLSRQVVRSACRLTMSRTFSVRVARWRREVIFEAQKLRLQGIGNTAREKRLKSCWKSPQIDSENLEHCEKCCTFALSKRTNSARRK